MWEEGVFGGRSFDVLMTRLPIEKLHERLDKAYLNFPESNTLNDFRATSRLIDLENSALSKSNHVITPHQEISDIFNNKSIKLNWTLPQPMKNTAEAGKCILFPASATGRKGAYEIKRLALELDLTIVVTGKATETPDFWNGVKIESAQADIFSNIGLVVYPAYIEHQPRLLLKAIANGVPVITTTACGLTHAKNITIIPIGDYEMLKKIVKQNLGYEDKIEKLNNHYDVITS